MSQRPLLKCKLLFFFLKISKIPSSFSPKFARNISLKKNKMALVSVVRRLI